MEFGATNLAVPHKLSLLNALESLADLRERGRNSFLPSSDVTEEGLVCPKPHRAGAGISATFLDVSAKPLRRLRGTTSLPVIGDAGHEILDILYSKVNCGDSGGPGSPNKYLSGSPPSRASNPLIYDAQFTQKQTMPSSMAIPQKSMCSASSLVGSTSAQSNSSVKSTCCSSPYGSKPFIRIEGFASATPDSNRGVPAYA